MSPRGWTRNCVVPVWYRLWPHASRSRGGLCRFVWSGVTVRDCPAIVTIPDADDAVDENHRACVLDAAGATGPSLTRRRHRQSADAHARRRIVALAQQGISGSARRARRRAAVRGRLYPLSHWDHAFGGIEVDAPIVAHASTAERLIALAAMDWSDEGLDRRVAAGEATPEHAANVREELPAPRIVEVAPADVIFHEDLEIELGGATVTVRHLGGDHSTDSSVMYVEPDRVLFLGDCTYPSPRGVLTGELAFPLHEAVLAFGAEHFVEGHHPSVVSRHEMEQLVEKMRLAERAVTEGVTITAPDEDIGLFRGRVRGRTLGGVVASSCFGERASGIDREPRDSTPRRRLDFVEPERG
jgi:glyoxylase-like metal-dependent hydrolase (beta-lactamase superfamily II)